MSADPPRAETAHAQDPAPDDDARAEDVRAEDARAEDASARDARTEDERVAPTPPDPAPVTRAERSPFADLAPRPVAPGRGIGPRGTETDDAETTDAETTDAEMTDAEATAPAKVPTVPALGSLTGALAGGPDDTPHDDALDDDTSDSEVADDAMPASPYGTARLYGTPENPVPEGARVETLATADGVRLRVAMFRATRRPVRGTVLLLQGRNECIEKYFETARDLGARGFVTVAFDWRGQGGSQRLLRDPQRGHVRSFRDYETDLAAALDAAEQLARPPFSIVAHSSGGLTALLATPRLAGRVERIVALAPLVRLVGLPVGQRVLRWVMGLARAVGLGRFYAAGGPRPEGVPDFLTNVLTTDPGRHERNGRMFETHRHLGLGGPTVAWVHSACRAMDRLAAERHLRAVRVPSLLIAAGDDDVVSTAAQERLVRRMRNANMLTIDGARHELLQERDRYREQVLAAIEAFAARDEVRASERPAAA